MTLRRLGHTDLENLFALRLESLERDSSAFRATPDEERARGISFYETVLRRSGDDNVIFGAFVDSKLVAIMGIFRGERPKISHKATIWGVYVAPAYRGQKLSSQLLDLALLHARKKMNVQVVTLSADSQNHHAIKLYESRGFVKWGTEPCAMTYQDKSFDEVNMSLLFA